MPAARLPLRPALRRSTSATASGATASTAPRTASSRGVSPRLLGRAPRRSRPAGHHLPSRQRLLDHRACARRPLDRHLHGLHAARGPGHGHALRRHRSGRRCCTSWCARRSAPPRSARCSTSTAACWASRASRTTCATLLEAEAQGNERAKLAIDVFCYRLRKYIAAYVGALGGIDARRLRRRDRRERRRRSARAPWPASTPWACALDPALNAAARGAEAEISPPGRTRPRVRGPHQRGAADRPRHLPDRVGAAARLIGGDLMFMDDDARAGPGPRRPRGRMPEGLEERAIRAAALLRDQQLVKPILIGPAAAVRERAAALGVALDGHRGPRSRGRCRSPAPMRRPTTSCASTRA